MNEQDPIRSENLDPGALCLPRVDLWMLYTGLSLFVCWQALVMLGNIGHPARFFRFTSGSRNSKLERSRESELLSAMVIPGSPQFQDTRWSLVLQAHDDDSQVARRALSELCEFYWYPLYSFIRRTGRSAHDAEDLTQEFLHRLLRRRDLARADPSKGRLGSYLLGAVKHFLSDESAKERAAKRGGGQPPLALTLNCDRDGAESRFERSIEVADALTPEQLYDRQWALATLDRALARLRAEYKKRGKEELFVGLEPFLAWNSGGDYAAAAVDLGISETSIRVGVHRLRERFRRSLRDEIAQTVGSMEELEEELQDFPRLLG